MVHLITGELGLEDPLPVGRPDATPPRPASSASPRSCHCSRSIPLGLLADLAGHGRPEPPLAGPLDRRPLLPADPAAAPHPGRHGDVPACLGVRLRRARLRRRPAARRAALARATGCGAYAVGLGCTALATVIFLGGFIVGESPGDAPAGPLPGRRGGSLDHAPGNRGGAVRSQPTCPRQPRDRRPSQLDPASPPTATSTGSRAASKGSRSRGSSSASASTRSTSG